MLCYRLARLIILIATSNKSTIQFQRLGLNLAQLFGRSVKAKASVLCAQAVLHNTDWLILPDTDRNLEGELGSRLHSFINPLRLCSPHLSDQNANPTDPPWRSLAGLGIGRLPGAVGHLDGGSVAAPPPAARMRVVACPRAAEARAGAVAVVVAAWLPRRPGAKASVGGLVSQLRTRIGEK